MTPLTLHDWREEIRIEAPRVGKFPYSHNLVSISLQAIAHGWGDEEANKAIRDFNLEAIGWEQKV